MFIAEGALVIRRLLRSPYRVRSVLVSDRGARALEGELASATAPVYVASQPVIEAICGFRFHRGALAAADRLPPVDVAQLAASAELLLVVEGISDNENLGALFRNAAAFGAGGVILDPTSADPLYRRTIRVSMGHVLQMPFARADDWPAAIGALRDCGFEVLALTPTACAEDVSQIQPGGRRAVLVGTEGKGLSAAALASADRRVRIPIADGVDSLNVATAAAIALHRLAQVPL